MLRIALSTLGCRVNQAETDALAHQLCRAGYRIVAPSQPADLHIINSCSITHDAAQQTLRLVRRLRRQGGWQQIWVTGCYATAQARAQLAADGATVVIGNADKEKIVDLVALWHAAATTGAASCTPPSAQLTRAHAEPLRAATSPNRSRAYLKIQDGCDYRCAFCIVPQVRGKSRSLALSEVRAQLDALVATAVPEVVLTGVHLGTYGRDLEPRHSFTDLIAHLLPRLGAVCRLRISSLDPHEVDPQLIALMAANRQKIARYMHLPLQSGDNSVLALMRRAHTTSDIIATTHHLAQAVPGIGIGADVIVGFPQESDAAFNNTYELLEQLPLAYLHVFRYSRRPGTTAAALPDQVDADVKEQRSQRLRQLSRLKWQHFATQALGQTLAAVVLLRRDRNTGLLTALTDNYLKVLCHGPDSAMRQWVEVRPTHIAGDRILGELA